MLIMGETISEIWVEYKNSTAVQASVNTPKPRRPMLRARTTPVRKLVPLTMA
jgi:hypothetical protein